LGANNKDRDLKKGKEDDQHSFGLGCTQDQKNIVRNSSYVEEHFSKAIKKAASLTFKSGISILVVCAFCMMLFICGAHSPIMPDNHITQNFTVREFTRKCEDSLPGRLKPNLHKLSQNLQVIRDHIQRPIIIISGYRSFRCNARVKGAKRSQHVHAKAVDIVVKGMSHRELQKAILKLIHEKKIDEGGVGFYRTHVHYDIRGHRSRWHKVVDKFMHVLERFTDEGG
jgi:hypothetical protein